MSDEAKTIIDGLGGTRAVARLTYAPTSTVNSWRNNGLSPSRLDHLRLAAKEKGLPWPLDSEPGEQASPDIRKENVGAAA